MTAETVATLPAEPPAELLAEAEAFLTLFHTETGTPGLAGRLAQMRHEVAQTGSYTLTPAELSHGAKVAWRNSTRCVGRLYWQALEVRDLRHVSAAPDVFGHLLAHLRDAFNGGHIKPLMSVFGPGVRILNPQLIRYADDPLNADFCGLLREFGWQPRGERFEVLPLAIEAEGEVQLFDLPKNAVQEVDIWHPDYPALADLGLKWHALPVISDMSLEVGGLRFAAAPFNGWYMQTEIAARDLADADRYDALPAVARALDLDTRRERSLWRDRALLELNVAVLHSFEAAGVKLVDHHTATRHFARFEEREAQAGREVRGKWSWLIPPLSPATTPVWGRRYRAREEKPNFVRCPYAGAHGTGRS